MTEARRRRPAFEARVIATGLAVATASTLAMGMALSNPPDALATDAPVGVSSTQDRSTTAPEPVVPAPPATTSGGS